MNHTWDRLFSRLLLGFEKQEMGEEKGKVKLIMFLLGFIVLNDILT